MSDQMELKRQKELQEIARKIEALILTSEVADTDKVFILEEAVKLLEKDLTATKR